MPSHWEHALPGSAQPLPPLPMLGSMHALQPPQYLHWSRQFLAPPSATQLLQVPGAGCFVLDMSSTPGDFVGLGLSIGWTGGRVFTTGTTGAGCCGFRGGRLLQAWGHLEESVPQLVPPPPSMQPVHFGPQTSHAPRQPFL